MRGFGGSTPEQARELAALDTTPELPMQKLYELRLAREEVGGRVEKLPKLTERKRIKARRAA